MSKTFLVSNGEVSDPTGVDAPLHEIKQIMSDELEIDIIGLTGCEDKIRSVIIPEDADVSKIENYLGSRMDEMDE